MPTHQPRKERQIGEAPPALVTVLATLVVASIGSVGCGQSDLSATWQPSDRVRPVSATEGGLFGSAQQESDDSQPRRESGGFQPPYPDRDDPFAFADQPVVEVLLDTAATQVKILGFMNVGAKQAMLSINGKTQIVKVGDVVAGIEILQIDSPNVRLRNLYRTWTIGLFDEKNAVASDRK